MTSHRTHFARGLALAAVAGMLVVACGGDEEPGAAEPDATESSVIATTAAGNGDGTSAGTLTIYSGRGEDLVGPLLEQFEAATGVDTEVRYGDSAEMLLLIQEEGENSPADVYYSQGAGFLGVLSNAGGLTELPADVLDLHQRACGRRTPTGSASRAEPVRSSTTPTCSPRPTCLHRSSTWRTRSGPAASAGPPPTHRCRTSSQRSGSIVGEDDARSWLDGIVANAAAYEGNTAILEAVAAGEVEVGLVNHYYLYQYLAEDPDFPVANHFFDGGDPGSLVNIAGAGVLATSDETDLAMALMRVPAVTRGADATSPSRRTRSRWSTGVDTATELPTIDSLSLPDFDLNLLADLQGTVDLLTEVGAL